jgi:RNA polymerase sigma-70 factor (ECF subfamily)
MSINPIYHQTPSMLELELVQINLAKNDSMCFAPLYEKYYDQIFRYIFQRVDTVETAEDITSQVFLKAINKLDSYEYRGLPFGSWLYRIAKSELYQSFRNNQAVRTVNIDTVHLYEMVEVFQEDTSQLKLAQLLNSMNKLKEIEIQLLELRFFEKRSFKEISQIMSITENNAKVKCFRILIKLKKIFLKINLDEKYPYYPKSAKINERRNSQKAKLQSLGAN